MSRDETYELDEIVFVTETDLAILVRMSDVEEADAVMGEDQWWIPKSVIVSRDVYKSGDEGYVELYERFAEREGIA